MNIVDKVRKHAVKGLLIVTIPAVIATSGCGISEENKASIITAYEQQQTAQEKIDYDAAQVAKIPDMEEQVAKIPGIETQLGELETAVTEGFEGVPGQVSDALKDYFGEEEQKDTERYDPSHTGRQHDVSHTGRSTPYKAGSVDEVEAAVRYYSTIGALKNMRNKSGFKNIFGSVPYEWVDGVSSRWNRELESNNAFYINEKQGIAIFYFRDGGKSTRNISAGRAEDFIVNHLWNKPSDINKFTIVEAGPHYK